MTQIFSAAAASRLQSIADEIFLGVLPNTSLKDIWPEEALADDTEVARFLTEHLATHDGAGIVEVAPADYFDLADRHANKLIYVQGDTRRLFAIHYLRLTALSWRGALSQEDLEAAQAHKLEEDRYKELWATAVNEASSFTKHLWESAYRYASENKTALTDEQQRDFERFSAKHSCGEITVTIGNIALLCTIMGVSLSDIAARLVVATPPATP